MHSVTHYAAIILASKSPRRRQLLQAAGIEFDIVPSNIQENNFLFLKPNTYVQILAEAKAREVSERHPEHWVIGADSIVVINDTILEKPTSLADARQMIQQLSGNTHLVFTGYAIACKKNAYIFSESVKTEVTFKPLADEEIEWYIHTEEPYDKAGGYAIQGLGSFMVKHINGSYSNVVGLPICEVMDHLYRCKVISRKNIFKPHKV